MRNVYVHSRSVGRFKFDVSGQCWLLHFGSGPPSKFDYARRPCQGILGGRPLDLCMGTCVRFCTRGGYCGNHPWPDIIRKFKRPPGRRYVKTFLIYDFTISVLVEGGLNTHLRACVFPSSGFPEVPPVGSVRPAGLANSAGLDA